MNKISDSAFNQLINQRELKKEHFRALTFNQLDYLFKNYPEYYHQFTKADQGQEIEIKKFMELTFDELNELYKEEPETYERLNRELQIIKKGKADFLNYCQRIEGKFRQKGIGSYYRGYVEEFKEDILVAKYNDIFELSIDKMLERHSEELKQLTKDAFIKTLKIDFSNKLRERGRRNEADEIIKILNL